MTLHWTLWRICDVREMESVVCGDPGTDILMFATHFINKHRAFHYPIKFFWYLKDFLQTQLMTQRFNARETWKESNFPLKISLAGVIAAAHYVTGNWTMWTDSSPSGLVSRLTLSNRAWRYVTGVCFYKNWGLARNIQWNSKHNSWRHCVSC